MGSGSYLFDTLVYPSDVAMAELCLIALEEAIGLARQIGWLAGEANALIDYALTLGARGHYATALEAAQTALTIAVEIDHAMWRSTACLALGALYLDLLNAPEAQSYLEVAWKVAEGLNSIYIRRTIGGFLAFSYLEQHMFDQASEVLAQVIDPDVPLNTQAQRIAWTAQAAYWLAIGDSQSGLDILNRLIASAYNLTDHSAVIPRLWFLRGEGLRERQQWPEAEESLSTALQSAKKQNILPLVWRIQVSLGALYKTTAQLAEAEKMFESARHLIEELAATLDTSTSQKFLEQALKMIPYQPLLTSHQAAKRKYGGLTRREREIATEIAVGKSNQEIADTLVISERTVEKHVSNILSKLYLTSRREIAAWTVEKGLTRSK
jgi:DNA-binding CsgD family transcriptional regulator